MNKIYWKKIILMWIFNLRSFSYVQSQEGHGFEPWKQPVAEMHDKAAYNLPLWFSPFTDPVP